MAVHEIKRVSLLDVPAKLRALADEIEGSKQPYTVIAVIGDAAGYVHVRSFGPRSSSLEASGWLARAQTTLTEGAENTEPIPEAS